MLGFGDLEDGDIVTVRDLARRLGYSEPSSMWRALKKRGHERPIEIIRGKYSGAVLKAWSAGISSMLLGLDGPEAPPGKTSPVPAVAEGAAVIGLEAERARLAARIKNRWRDAV